MKFRVSRRGFWTCVVIELLNVNDKLLCCMKNVKRFISLYALVQAALTSWPSPYSRWRRAS